jgi:hypothetical protein
MSAGWLISHMITVSITPPAIVILKAASSAHLKADSASQRVCFCVDHHWKGFISLCLGWARCSDHEDTEASSGTAEASWDVSGIPRYQSALATG